MFWFMCSRLGAKHVLNKKEMSLAQSGLSFSITHVTLLHVYINMFHSSWLPRPRFSFVDDRLPALKRRVGDPVLELLFLVHYWQEEVGDETVLWSNVTEDLREVVEYGGKKPARKVNNINFSTTEYEINAAKLNTEENI